MDCSNLDEFCGQDIHLSYSFDSNLAFDEEISRSFDCGDFGVTNEHDMNESDNSYFLCPEIRPTYCQPDPGGFQQASPPPEPQSYTELIPMQGNFENYSLYDFEDKQSIREAELSRLPSFDETYSTPPSVLSYQLSPNDNNLAVTSFYDLSHLQSLNLNDSPEQYGSSNDSSLESASVRQKECPPVGAYSPALESRAVGAYSPALESRAVGAYSPALESRAVGDYSPALESRAVGAYSPALESRVKTEENNLENPYSSNQHFDATTLNWLEHSEESYGDEKFPANVLDTQFLSRTKDILVDDCDIASLPDDGTADWLKEIRETKNARPRGPKCWEFLLRLLMDVRSNPSLIRWEDQEKGVFRLVNKDRISAIWGSRPCKKKKEEGIKYDSFARNLRYHYKSGKGKVRSVSEKHLVYKFPLEVMELFFNKQIR